MNLQIQNLSFGYTRQKVLHEIELSVESAGQVIAVIGPNATGKSTLFRCIAGLLKPTEGTISLDGDTLTGMGVSQWTKRVCFTPQFFSSNAALTVFETILLAKKHLNGWRVTTDDIDAISCILSELNIAHLAQTYISDLSGGQQQMASIGSYAFR